jgi:hypothetical protein
MNTSRISDTFRVWDLGKTSITSRCFQGQRQKRGREVTQTVTSTDINAVGGKRSFPVAFLRAFSSLFSRPPFRDCIISLQLLNGGCENGRENAR